MLGKKGVSVLRLSDIRRGKLSHMAVGAPMIGAYSASKFAVRGLTQSTGAFIIMRILAVHG
jgi:NAD(P)-dependent dehydrogenase (short-subunit alcohol dehydrogenase family)